eukprot:Filipodium_phascolosomae@DN2467_c0_g1_i4.p1
MLVLAQNPLPASKTEHSSAAFPSSYEFVKFKCPISNSPCAFLVDTQNGALLQMLEWQPATPGSFLIGNYVYSKPLFMGMEINPMVILLPYLWHACDFETGEDSPHFCLEDLIDRASANKTGHGGTLVDTTDGTSAPAEVAGLHKVLKLLRPAAHNKNANFMAQVCDCQQMDETSMFYRLDKAKVRRYLEHLVGMNRRKFTVKQINEATLEIVKEQPRINECCQLTRVSRSARINSALETEATIDPKAASRFVWGLVSAWFTPAMKDEIGSWLGWVSCPLFHVPCTEIVTDSRKVY